MSASDRSRTPELERGRAAYERREWRAAYESLSAADRDTSLDADDLWRLGMAAFLLGHDDDFVEALERAYRIQADAGDAGPAARSATWLGLHLAETGEMARATGWFGRASRVLDTSDSECVEHGYLLLPTIMQQLSAGDNAAAARTAAEAAECAQRFGDRDLLALAVHMQGRALLRQARVEPGLALLDEAMVAVVADELSPQVTGLIYCSVISACRRVYALDRAHEWTAALTEWCERQPDMVAFTGECRVYRAELLRLHGAWPEALDEARRVSEGAPPEETVAGLALYQQGEVQRLRGELAAAEESFRAASRAGREPQPGLSLLRLAQGDEEAAAAAIRRALAETDDPLGRVRLLPSYIDIMLAVDELAAAEQASQELDELAETFGTGVLGTMAAQARGALALAREEPSAALGPLRKAWREWNAVGATYDAARVRELIGRACQALGDEDTAALELDAARATFERLGAQPDVARIDAMGRSAGPRDTHGLTPRELEVLGLVATGKTNRAIAEALFISEKTVARHVSNIFTKLGLSSRAAATAYAYEHDLTRTST